MTPHLGYHYYKLQVLLRYSASATPALTLLLSSLASALICLMLPLLSASQALGLTTVAVAAVVAAAGQPSPGRSAVLPNALPHLLPRLAFPVLRRPAVPAWCQGVGIVFRRKPTCPRKLRPKSVFLRYIPWYIPWYIFIRPQVFPLLATNSW